MYGNGKAKIDSLRFLIPAVAADVLKRCVDILLAGFTAAAIAFVVLTVSWSPTYSMKASYAIMTKVSTGYETYSTGSVSNTVATTFEYLVESEILQEWVADILGTDTLNGTIEAEIADDTNIMYLTVTASSPQEAYEIMTAVTDNYQDLVDIVMGSITLSEIEEPTIPTSPSNPLERRPVMIKAFLAAVLFMIILLSAVSVLKDTVKTEEDFSEKLGVRRLATIPKEKRRINPAYSKKNRDYILINRFPVSYSFTENIGVLRTNFEYRAEKHKSKVVLVTSALPNEGKSTVSINLAMALAKTGKKVAYIDGDLRNPTIYKMLRLDREINRDLGEFLQGGCKIDEVMILYKNPAMHILAGKNRYENAAELLSSNKMRSLVAALKEVMDYVVIDLPPAGAMVDTEEVSGYADGIVLVVKQNNASSKIIRDVLDSLAGAGASVLGCVFNNVRILGRGNTIRRGR